MPTVADVLSRARKRTREIRVQMDGQLLGELDRLRDDFKAALREDRISGEGLGSKAPGVRRRLEELEAEADKTATWFKLQAVSGERLDELKRAYPPTEEQWRRYREEAQAKPMFTRAPEFNFDEVLPRLIGLSVIEVDGEAVEWGEDDGVALWAELHDGARADLGDAVWDVNNKSSLRPTSGTGTDTTPTSGPESTSSANGASPTRSSQDG